MKVLFLDVDGVMNSKNSLRLVSERRPDMPREIFHSERGWSIVAINALKRVIRETD